jgi:hypothetical protein
VIGGALFDVVTMLVIVLGSDCASRSKPALNCHVISGWYHIDHCRGSTTPTSVLAFTLGCSTALPFPTYLSATQGLPRVHNGLHTNVSINHLMIFSVLRRMLVFNHDGPL